MSRQNDMFKEFTCMGVTVTRDMFESMPCPMAAHLLDAAAMQKVASDTRALLLSAGWEQWDIDSCLIKECPGKEGCEKAEALEDSYWRFAEQAAIENGMQYYEDMPDVLLPHAKKGEEK